jgi:hypothetical protein
MLVEREKLIGSVTSHADGGIGSNICVRHEPELSTGKSMVLAGQKLSHSLLLPFVCELICTINVDPWIAK